MMSQGTIQHYNNAAAAEGLERRFTDEMCEFPEARETFQDRARQEYITDYAEDYEDADELSEAAEAYASDSREWGYRLLEDYLEALEAELSESGMGRGLEPLHITPDDVFSDRVRHLKQIPAEKVADGFDLAAEYFVDSSGFGGPHEPALTFGAFCDRGEALVAEHGGAWFCIVSAGQFQVYINAYTRSE